MSPAASAPRPTTKASPTITTCPTKPPMPKPAPRSAWSSGRNRMLGLRPDGRYADIMEQALYNGALSGLSLDGEASSTRTRWKAPASTIAGSGTIAPAARRTSPGWSPRSAAICIGLADDEIAVHLYGESNARFESAKRLCACSSKPIILGMARSHSASNLTARPGSPSLYAFRNRPTAPLCPSTAGDHRPRRQRPRRLCRQSNANGRTEMRSR